jgi:hypothetical protein
MMPAGKCWSKPATNASKSSARILWLSIAKYSPKRWCFGEQVNAEMADKRPGDPNCTESAFALSAPMFAGLSVAA